MILLCHLIIKIAALKHFSRSADRGLKLACCCFIGEPLVLLVFGHFCSGQDSLGRRESSSDFLPWKVWSFLSVLWVSGGQKILRVQGVLVIALSYPIFNAKTPTPTPTAGSPTRNLSSTEMNVLLPSPTYVCGPIAQLSNCRELSYGLGIGFACPILTAHCLLFCFQSWLWSSLFLFYLLFEFCEFMLFKVSW